MGGSDPQLSASSLAPMRAIQAHLYAALANHSVRRHYFSRALSTEYPRSRVSSGDCVGSQTVGESRCIMSGGSPSESEIDWVAPARKAGSVAWKMSMTAGELARRTRFRSRTIQGSWYSVSGSHHSRRGVNCIRCELWPRVARSLTRNGALLREMI